MPSARINGIDLHYEIHGSGPLLYLISGLGGSARFWEPNLAALTRDYTVVLHDQRGTDRSERPETAYSVEMLADDVVALMDHLGHTRARFIGHSTGGAICQVLATKSPARVEAMVLYASWPATDAHFRWCFKMRRNVLDGAGRDAYAHGNILFMYPAWYVQDNAEALEAEAHGAAEMAQPYAVVTARIDAILAFDWLEHLTEVKTPTLVVCAADDILTPPYQSRRLAHAIAGSRLEVLETGGHSCSRVVPEQFNALVGDFFATSSA
ncbi:alpha/beta fold hydrolase [Caballeronia sp. LZ034LL]|uniref:alpha/beta fold hydrolase n=1 Tax=Caballeronia sp. LZ034LL TaxID=3038567 RepID=UPI00285B3653|nr:alpha/beta fold hydrolase [Caballeronia sp. LZ034LL]MDR5835675.1 alpha/beta fold hydrolase [Caballeronia sp. LZ034LL]